MDFRDSRFYAIIVLTFIIVFLMNYIGNDAENKLQLALQNGFAGAVGIAVGLWLWYRNKGDSSGDRPDFD